MLFALTFYTAYKNRTENIPLLYPPSFRAMALATLSNVLTFYVCSISSLITFGLMCEQLAGPFLRGGLSSFASSVSVTLMSRLVLNLHQTTDTGVMSDNNDSTPEDVSHELDTLPLSDFEE
ncbi:uncharacterized protein EV420DRAFT_1588018 [Desarmillaria tabescens]|uniref:Uncharacterized protein n=1 Tax=Armillaria tabescens TaxID=1929756 RepID=A0AA39MKB3_ARMTA|nr:uncharacterized protein EV420DRAFT_1588018 [Desarmillaria tabescens]KAK0437462.1 hypothetical protein EV420DRAFT_1588018 [Desarmillaria tabescens]